MSKQLDHEELWDSFTWGERQAIFIQVPPKAEYRLTPEVCARKWRNLPTTLKLELGVINWEFSLGRRFASPA